MRRRDRQRRRATSSRDGRRLTRATRGHPAFKKGASVRAAIASVTIAGRLDGRRRAASGAPRRPALGHRAWTCAHDIDADFDAALDELFDAVVERGEDPDAVAAERRGGERRGAQKKPERRRRRAAPPARSARPRASAARPAGRAAAEALRSRPSPTRYAMPLALSTAGRSPSISRAAAAGSATATCAMYAERSGGATPCCARAAEPRRPRCARPPRRRRASRCASRTPAISTSSARSRTSPARTSPRPTIGWSSTARERRQQVVLMVDTSLSMSGENMAMAAVAAAVLALKLHPGDLSVVVFERQGAGGEPPRGAVDQPGQVVRRMLEQPVRGYTNIEAALELGAAELERGRNPRRAGLLITDGVVDVRAATRCRLAARFSSALRHAHRGLQDEPRALPPPGRRGARRRLPRQELPRAAATHARRRRSRASLD